MLGLSPQQIDSIYDTADRETQQIIYQAATHPYYTFQPRPDAPDEYDEQTGFIESEAAIAFAVGGNGSGKTQASAHKCARFLLEKQAPPRRDTPFWIVSNTYDMVCGVCWDEKLSNIIPKQCIDWERIYWYKVDRNWPFAVPLKPWPGHPDKNWVIEFKSYEQGRMNMQARSIGGMWFSEQFTWEIFTEALRGCREYMFPGSVFGEFTPIDPALSVEIENRFDDPPEGYEFFRLNTERNVEFGGASRQWYNTFMATVSEEMRETRRTGAFASYEGSIYQTFNPKIHLVESIEVPRSNVSAATVKFTKDSNPVRLGGLFFRRGIDWGFSLEHPFVCLWAFRDGTGRYFFYDEYWSNSGDQARKHLAAIRSPDRHQFHDEPWFGATYADPSRPEYIREFSEAGMPTVPAINDFMSGIECVRQHLGVTYDKQDNPQTRIYIDKHKCPKLAQQMRTYRWKKSGDRGLNPQSAKPEPLKKNDDACDVLRYILRSDSHSTAKLFEHIQSERQYGRHGVNLARNSTGYSRNRVNGNGRH